MSVLIHDCTGCGHRQDHHGVGGNPSPSAPRSSCSCCARPAPVAINPEPKLWQTFTYPGNEPEPLHAPGSVRDGGTAHRSNVCGCDRCHEIAAEMSEASQ